MKKVIGFILLAVLILGGAGAAVWRFYFDGDDDVPARLVLYGNVDVREVNLAFNGSERIEKIMVEEGARVKKGQLLARLRTRRLSLYADRIAARIAALEHTVDKLEAGTRREEIEKVRAEVDAIRIEARNAGRTYRRLRPLSEKNLVSQDRADDAKALLEAKKARLKAAEETLQLALAGPREEDIAAEKARLEALRAEGAIARENLADAMLHAPSDGVIRNRILEEGDMASPRRTAFVLALTDPVWIRAFVSETDLGKIYPGMAATIRTDSHPDKRYEGWVGYISPTAEFTPKSVQTPDVRTRLVYQVRIFARNPDRELRLGMPATVVIPLDQDGAAPAGDDDGSKDAA